MDIGKRDKIVDLVRKLLLHTVENGCTPGEAAKFAAKAAELMEAHQIEEAELRVKTGGASFNADDVEVCQNELQEGVQPWHDRCYIWPGDGTLLPSNIAQEEGRGNIRHHWRPSRCRLCMPGCDQRYTCTADQRQTRRC